MSVIKCGYSPEYKLLLKRKLKKDTTETKEEFKKFVEENFSNPEEIYRKFLSGVEQTPSEPSSFEPKKISSRTGAEIKTEDESPQQYYLGIDNSQYNKMSDDFAKKMISISIFDLDSQTFINPNQEIGDTTYLNKKILDYKKSLLTKLAKYIGEVLPNIEEYSGNELSEVFNDILSKFTNVINQTKDFDDNYYEAYNAYVILKTFDKLLSTVTPFIQIRPEYVKSSQYFKQRYYYVGPKVKHDTGVFGNNEHADINNAMSDLCKILLKYFPKVNSQGKDIKNTSIGINAFNSVMNKLKSWAESSTNDEVQSEWRKGTTMDVGKLIDMYEESLASYQVSPEHITYLRSTLAGIKRYIYNPKMQEDIKYMFTHLMEKTVLSSYVGYVQPRKSEEMKVENITERTIYLQQEDIKECIKAASTYWKNNKAKFDNILNNHKIVIVSDNEFKINGISVKRNSEGLIWMDESTINEGSIENIEKLVGDIAALIVPDDFDEVASEVFPNSDKNNVNLYIPVIGSIIFNVSSKNSHILTQGQGRDLAKVLSVIYGSDIINVIQNSEGNNLPLYQLNCLIYRHNDIWNEINTQIDNNEDDSSQYDFYIIYNNIQHIKAPMIRSEVVVGDISRTSSKLTAADVMHLAIGYDFFLNLTKGQSLSDTGTSKYGIIKLQPNTFSDKGRHFMATFDLSAPWTFGNGYINFSQVFNSYFQTGDKAVLKPIINAWFISNQAQLKTILETLKSDYGKVFNKEFKTLDDIKTFLSNYMKNHSIDDLRRKFFDNGITFVDEFHASKLNKKWTVNETIEYLSKVFSNEEEFNKFVSYQFDKFLKNASPAFRTLSKDKSIIEVFKQINQKFVKVSEVKDSNSKKTSKISELLLTDSNGNINPMLYAFFITDAFLGNEYNKMMVGNVFAHANKNNEKSSDPNYFIHSLASRWIAQTKRMVIMGATYHSYAQGLKNGVAERVKIAFMADVEANFNNMLGMSDETDSMDGSGYTSPYFSRQQNTSLLDAAVSSVNKTIYHHIDARTGTPTLLKWAEYPITNALRRNSQTVSLERMFKKMHDFVFTKNINFSSTFDNLYFRDNKTGNYYKILSIDINNGTATRRIAQVNKQGEIISDVNSQTFEANSIYKLDQIFGGAWAMELNSLTNDLQYSENNLDYVNNIICDFDLKNDMISWLVNKSAVKVGAANLNSKSSWFDDKPLMFTTISTKFGGLQMKASHELDEAEVTEMTQMISALEQNGYTHDIAQLVYAEIGKFCYDAISKIEDILYTGNKDKLYEIFGKAIIKAFQSGSKDTLGLAQSFIKLAQKGFSENNINYKIPFSSSSINGIFNSTVSSSLVRDAIRRHYDGVPAVLNPSHNVMQYYNYNGNNYRYEELIDVINKAVRGTQFEGLTIQQATNDVFVKNNNNEEVLNPFLNEITPEDPVDFEDTIVIFNAPNEDGTFNKIGKPTSQRFEIVKINTYEQYDYYRHHEKRLMRRWTLKPKNLKGSDTIFFDDKGKKYSMYESPYAKALHYFVEAKLGSNDIESLKEEILDQVKEDLKDISLNDELVDEVFNARWNAILTGIQPFMVNGKIDLNKSLPNIKRYLVKKQQEVLNSLSELKSLKWGNEKVIPSSFKVLPAQIAMGKLYAKQLGLLPGDTITEIKKQGTKFFEDRISGYYVDTNFDVETYDWVLYDGTGNKLYVKLKTKDTDELFANSSLDSEYKIIDGSVYYKSKEICSADGKQFRTYIDSSGNQHNVAIVDDVDRFKELQNSKAFNYTQRNYRIDNYKTLTVEEFNLQKQIDANGKEFYNYGPINLTVFGTNRKGNATYITKNIAEFDDTNSIIYALAENQEYWKDRKIKKLAETKFKSFEKSLRFVGTRIPCQSMQSFAPMEIILFTDSTENEVYIPSMISVLEGSDFDRVMLK